MKNRHNIQNTQKSQHPLENLFEGYFLSPEDRDYAFQNVDKDKLRKVIEDFPKYLKGILVYPPNTFVDGIGIENNDEQVILSVNSLYQLWERSEYWVQRKGKDTLYIFGMSYSEEFNSFIIGGYLHPQDEFVALHWEQSISTIGLLTNSLNYDEFTETVRLKKDTALYRLFNLAKTA